MNILFVLIGQMGAGKTSVAMHIHAAWGFSRVSSGDLMRALLTDQTSIGDEIRRCAELNVPPDTIAEQTVMAKLAETPPSTGVVLDGFPRNAAQAASLQEYLVTSNRRLCAVIHLTVSERTSIDRARRRHWCDYCEAIVAISAGQPCQGCGKPPRRRAGADAEDATVLQRRHRFDRDTQPVVDSYARSGLVTTVDAERNLTQVLDTVDAVLRPHLTTRNRPLPPIRQLMSTIVNPSLTPEWDTPRFLVNPDTVPPDIFLRETLAQLRASNGGELTAILTTGSTFLLAKPEASVGRRLDSIHRFLIENDFNVLDVRPLDLDRRAVRDLWRDHLGKAPLAISKLVDLGRSAAPFTLFTLRRRADEPAAEVLRARKGRSTAVAGDGTLRGELHVETPVLNFVHTPDSPAKTFSELGLLVPEADLVEVLTRMAHGTALTADKVDSAIEAVYRRVPAHPLRFDTSVDRLSSSDPELAERVRDALEPDSALTPHCRGELIFELADVTAVPIWDRITLIAHVVGDSRRTFGMAYQMTANQSISV